MDAFYNAITDKKYVIDKSRGWGIHYDMIATIRGEQPKIICMVRDLRDVFASMESNFRKNPEKSQGIVNWSTGQATTVPKRIDFWIQNPPVGMAIERLQEIIRLHAEPTYRVYMLGFIPGFAYLGELNSKLTMPRKSAPQPMIPGSIGIAGLQTGIYPSFSPGGWNIIGHTDYPLLENGMPILQAGDRVKFIPLNQL
jgi:hypothetical protein